MSLCESVCSRAQLKQQQQVHLFIQLFNGSFIRSLGQPAAITNDKNRAEQCNEGRSRAALPAIKTAQQSRGRRWSRRWSWVSASVGSAMARTRARTRTMLSGRKQLAKQLQIKILHLHSIERIKRRRQEAAQNKSCESCKS